MSNTYNKYLIIIKLFYQIFYVFLNTVYSGYYIIGGFKNLFTFISLYCANAYQQ